MLEVGSRKEASATVRSKVITKAAAQSHHSRRSMRRKFARRNLGCVTSGLPTLFVRCVRTNSPWASTFLRKPPCLRDTAGSSPWVPDPSPLFLHEGHQGRLHFFPTDLAQHVEIPDESLSASSASAANPERSCASGKRWSFLEQAAMRNPLPSFSDSPGVARRTTRL